MIPVLGATASLSTTVSESDIEQFADLVGDHNPVHLDDAFALKTRFGRRIAHGMFSASLISAVLGTKLPGPGTIYLSQSLRFLAPVYPGDTVTAQVTVQKVEQRHRVVTLSTSCRNQDGKEIVEGEAVVLVESIE